MLKPGTGDDSCADFIGTTAGLHSLTPYSSQVEEIVHYSADLRTQKV